MSLTTVQGLQSEIFVPITPPPVWTPVTKELKDMTIALATAAGVHLKSDKRFNLAGDTTFRAIPNTAIDRLHELAAEGFIKGVAPMHYAFMGGGGNQHVFTEETGPAIAAKLKEEGVDGVVMTAGWGTCHRTAVIVQRAIEEAGIPTIIIAALPPVVRQNGTPRAVAPLVPMGANAGEPHNIEMQTHILRDTLEQLVAIPSAGKIVPLPYEYKAHV